MVEIPSYERILAQISAAEEATEYEPRARTARYDCGSKRIIIELTNGCEFTFPARIGQGLQDATDDQLANVKVIVHGSALEWADLGADLWVPGLLSGLFGTKAWMRELGRAGGKVRSEAKAQASRENGKKGGRPRKVRTEMATAPAEKPSSRSKRAA